MIPHPFFSLSLRYSSTYGIVNARFCNLSTWGRQHQHLHSVLAIVAYFRWNYKFFDRRHDRKGDKQGQNRKHKRAGTRPAPTLCEFLVGAALVVALVSVDFRKLTFGCRVWKIDLQTIWQLELCYAEKKISTFVHMHTNPRLDPDGCVRLLDDGRSGELAAPREQ